MVHQVQDRSPRKRDRCAAGLILTPGGGPELQDMRATEFKGEIRPPPTKMSRLGMYETYQPWVLQTYGDSAKTKTITRNKYQRILQILRGDYVDNETSKFKLWVKGRGFRIGPPPGYMNGVVEDPVITQLTPPPGLDYNPDKDPYPDIYVQTGTNKDPEGHDRICFKKVAVVEDFFDIIYNLHVCKDGKEQKHMGQKRTYRAVSERYAFVPREAVTKFLVLCTECPRRSVGVHVGLGVPLGVANLPVPPPTLPLPNLPPPPPPPPSAPPQPPNSRHSQDVTVKEEPQYASPVRLHHQHHHPQHHHPQHHHQQHHHLQHAHHHHTHHHPPTLLQQQQQQHLQQHHQHHHHHNHHQQTHLDHQHSPQLEKEKQKQQKEHREQQQQQLKQQKQKQEHEERQEKQQKKKDEKEEAEKEREAKEKEEEWKKQEQEEEAEEREYSKHVSVVSHQVDYRLPFTSIYLKHCRASTTLNKNNNYIHNNNNFNHVAWKDGPILAESDGSEDELKNEVERKLEARNPIEWTPYQTQPLGLTRNDVQRRSPCASPSGSERAATATPLDTASNAEDTSSNGNKDDEDDDADDDNDDDKIDAQYDPERLKAFNMFVRLFVDENLDRIVPISKQPKEKIQAIIDACARQFPEFAERTRKRIRTYLKSCRRNKRTRDSNGWETPSRPTPPHLTSIQAEQILANACENEAQNAKRMRLGLEPIAQPNPLNPQPPTPVGPDKPLGLVDTVVKTESNAPHVSALAKALERPMADSKVMNGSSMFQASFQQSFQKVTSLTGSTVHTQPGLTPLLATTSAPMLANGPTDLSVKGTSKPTRPTLNAVEVAAVRQLITGYRESAAFLLRSADELENLLIHQQSP
ncbi:nucleolar protein 4 isoform X2 [Procambarus clarkii]|uniref:nucleolar protein 4 isoform X2 n=1 Tax=Procambarus clarkii TaxID=6728 RepID=UPI003742C34F